MKKIYRYNEVVDTFNECECHMAEMDDGSWVLFDDYKELLDKVVTFIKYAESIPPSSRGAQFQTIIDKLRELV